MDNKMNPEHISSGEKKQKKALKVMGIIIAVIVALAILLVVLWKTNVIADLFKAKQTMTPSFIATDDSGNNEDEPSHPYNELESETVYNFLVVGHDRAANLADVTMLVRFDTKVGTVNIMQIPRDTYVTYDGYWYHKINGVYSYYMDNESENPELEGIKGYAEFVEKAFCVDIDFYAIMDLDQFVNIIDALGGVEIDVPQDMKYRDPNQNLKIDLKAGHQILDGKQSEQFVRFRSDYVQGDIGRVNAQKIFMAALFKTVKENVNIKNISTLCNIINENLVTNMSTKDMIYFANYAFKVNLKYVSMMTLPGKSATIDGLSYYCANREATLSYVNSYFNKYTADITNDIFDKNGTLDCGGDIYDAPANSVNGVVYDAQTLSDGEELPPR